MEEWWEEQDKHEQWIFSQHFTEDNVDINQAFPSKYLKASDLKGHAVKVTIRAFSFNEEGLQGKPVMYFDGKEKGLVVNKTNAMALAFDYGPDTDDWIGKEIELFSARTQFNGQMVDAIRVRSVKSVPMDEDGIPF